MSKLTYEDKTNIYQERNQGYNVNHKKVYRIMVKLGLKPLKRNKRKKSL